MSGMKITYIKWGKIAVNNQKYHDILIYDDTVEEREYDKLKGFYGTGHKIGDWEIKKLLSNNPEVIVVGTGWMGIVEVPEKLKAEVEKRKIILKQLKSPNAVKEYNKLIAEGKKVNVLIHSTC
jgi:hypothetical protein